jgi:hypothetical protein
MPISVSSPEDMINLSLVRIGYKRRIGSIFEGSLAARKALDIYSQTRDEVLCSKDWGFAGRDVVLTLLKQAPVGGYIPPITWNNTYPMLPWMFSYVYPSDCLKVRTVKTTPMFIPNFDPQPQIFEVENDPSLVPPQKVVLCNLPNALLLYTAQVTNPQDWEAPFIEDFAAALGRRLAPVLMNLDAAKLAAQDEQAENMVESREQE